MAKVYPCYSTTNTLKRAIWIKQRSLTREELCDYLQRSWADGRGVERQTAEKWVNLALNANKSFFKKDHEGKWYISKVENEYYDYIYKYMQKNKQFLIPKRINSLLRTKFQISSGDHSLVNLYLDSRFTKLEQQEPWLLSEWNLLNSLVFNYMDKKGLSIINRYSVEKEVRKEYKIKDENSVFFPELDKRFRVRKSDVIIVKEETNKKDEPVIMSETVLQEVRDNLGSAAVQIFESGDKGIKTKELVYNIFNITADNPEFRQFYEAINILLKESDNFLFLQNNYWVDARHVPDKAYNEIVHARGKQKEPDIKDHETSYEILRAKSKKFNDKKQQLTEQIRSLKFEIRFRHRLNGILPVGKKFKKMFNAGENKDLYKFKTDQKEYKCWWDGLSILYGEDVLEFFEDFKVEPGTIMELFKLETPNLFEVKIAGIDERLRHEQSILAKLYSESKLKRLTVEKTVFAVMCEILYRFPQGLHYKELTERVVEHRATTTDTVTTLLSSNPCFISLGKGMWLLDPSLIKAKYMYKDKVDYVVHWKEKNDNKISGVSQESACLKNFFVKKKPNKQLVFIPIHRGTVRYINTWKGTKRALYKRRFVFIDRLV